MARFILDVGNVSANEIIGALSLGEYSSSIVCIDSTNTNQLHDATDPGSNFMSHEQLENYSNICTDGYKSGLMENSKNILSDYENLMYENYIFIDTYLFNFNDSDEGLIYLIPKLNKLFGVYLKSEFNISDGDIYKNIHSFLNSKINQK